MDKQNKRFEMSLPNSPSDILGTSPLTEQYFPLFPVKKRIIYKKLSTKVTVADTNLTK